MSSINRITVDKLARLIGTPKCPAIVDVRIDEDFVQPRLASTLGKRQDLQSGKINGLDHFGGSAEWRNAARSFFRATRDGSLTYIMWPAS